MHADLIQSIVNKLAELRSRKGNVTIEDMGDLLEHIARSLTTETELDQFLRGEIMKIAQHIEVTKNEMLALLPESPPHIDMAAAASQLSAITATTEKAADAIMDAADAIQALIASASVDEKTREKITALTAKIYEGCHFQDLTGQRITKVLATLAFIDTKIRRLAELFASDGTLNVAALERAQAEMKRDPLLNGPALPKDMPSQTTIDGWFNKK